MLTKSSSFGLGLLSLFSLKLLASDFDWINSSLENWGTSTNWSPSEVPNASDATAIFNNGHRRDSITIDGTYSVGTLNFGTNLRNIELSHSEGILNLYDAIINQTQGNISCELSLQGNIAISNTRESLLAIEGPITGTGGITLNSGLIYFLGSDTATYSGTTTINSGNFEAGAPNVFSPNSAFVLADSVDASLTPGGSNNVISSLSGGSASTVSLMGSTLTIGDGTNTVYSGMIYDGSGGANPGGGIQKVGSGTLTLDGTNGYTGNTDVQGGTLALTGVNDFLSTATVSVSSGQITLGNNNSLGLATLTMADNTTLELNNEVTIPNEVTLNGQVGITVPFGIGVLSGSISGIGGSLIKTGPGNLTLNGNNSYTGTTTIIEGGLVTNGSTTSALTLSSGSILRGTGTFGPVTVNNGGTIAPGNSVGTITAASITFNPGSLFQVEINPQEASLLNITDTATLIGGNVQVVQDPGSYARNGLYLILDASSITGSFEPSVLGGLPGYVFSLSQTNNSLYLLYSLHTIPTKELSGNALKIANHLNEYANIPNLALFNSLPENSLKSSMNSISPARNAFGTYITQQTAFSLSNLLSTHIDNWKVSKEDFTKTNFDANLLTDASDEIHINKIEGSTQIFSTWISGFGEFAHQGALSQNPSFNYISEAVIAGFDCREGKKSLIGGALGYAHTHFYDKENAGHGNINYYFASIYSNTYIQEFYLSPAIWGVFNQIDNTRNITFPDFSKKAHSDIFAWQMIPHLEVGYDFKYDWGGFTPFTLADLAISWQRSYTEKGASPFNIAQQANNNSMVRSETGLKFFEKWQCSHSIFFLKEKISYVFEKPFGTGTVNAAFIGIPGAFTVSAVNQNLNLAAIGLNFLTVLGKDQSVTVDFAYNGEIGVNYWSNNIALTVAKRF